MKPVSLLLALMLLGTGNASAQELLGRPGSSGDYLFIGGLDDDRVKLLELDSGDIVWLPRGELKQSGLLSHEAFLATLLQHNLYFRAEGVEPFWHADIKRDHIMFAGDKPVPPDRQRRPANLQVQANGRGTFYLMFATADGELNGVISSRGYPVPTESMEAVDCPFSINDENSVFEVFISERGYAHRGCASIIGD